MSRTLARGGQNALSWPAFWVALATSVLISIPDQYTTWTAGTLWLNLLAHTVAVAAMFGVMLALRPFLLPRARTGRRPWRLGVLFATGAITRGIVLSALLPALGTGESRPLFRIVSSLVIMVPLLMITAGLVDLVRTSAARRAALQAEAGDLIAAEQQAIASTAALQQSAIAQVRTLLMQRIELLRDGISANLESRLQEDVEHVIRPMSHQLFAGQPTPRPEGSLPPLVRVVWKDVWPSASLGRPFRPILLASIAAIMCVNPLVTYNTGAARGLAYAVVVWGLVWVIFSVLAALVAERMRHMRSGPRTVVLVLAIISGLSAAGALFGIIMSATGGASPWRVPTALVAVGSLLAWLLALDQGFRRQVAAADAEQAAANAALEVTAALASADRRYEERRLSRALHGPVQTAVTAAAMRIHLGDESGAEALLVDAVGQLDPAADAPAPVAEALAEVTALWDGLCKVAAQVDPDVMTAIDARPTVAGAIVEICAEACANAVRHGGARRVDIRGTGSGNAVVLEVVDDGAPSGAGAGAGLGTAVLDEVALAWERYRDGDVTVLRATLPLSGPRERSVVAGSALAAS
jgi:hypothetical protein